MNDKVFKIHRALAPYPPIQLIYILWRRLIEQGPVAMYFWIRDKFDRRLLGCSARGQSEIIPGLHVGGQHNRHGLNEMRKRGIGAIVNMREEADDAERGILLDAYCWLPTTDDTAPTLEQLQKGVAFITEQIEQGPGVYIHCASGVGRAPTMAAAYLISKGFTVRQAWRTIQRGRTYVRPTPPQFEIIAQYAAQLTTTASTTKHSPETPESLEQRAVETLAEDPHLTQDLTDENAARLMAWAQAQVHTLIHQKISQEELVWDNVSNHVSALKQRMRTHARESALASDPKQELTKRLESDHFIQDTSTSKAI